MWTVAEIDRGEMTPPAARQAMAIPQVEPGAVLGEARRRQIHREPSPRKIQPGVLAGVVHALDGFAEGLVREPDDPELRCLVRHVGFDLDEMPIDAGERDRPGTRGRHAMSTRCSSEPEAGSDPMMPIASSRITRPRASSGFSVAHA